MNLTIKTLGSHKHSELFFCCKVPLEHLPLVKLINICAFKNFNLIIRNASVTRTSHSHRSRRGGGRCYAQQLQPCKQEMNVRLEAVEGFVAIHAHHDDDDNERQQQVEWVHGLFQACPKLAPKLAPKFAAGDLRDLRA